MPVMANLNNFESVLQAIHRQYIALPKKEVRRNVGLLKMVLTQIVNEMKRDAFFVRYYKRIFYGGSYFDGLKIGRPEEFDLDFLLKTPELGRPILEHSNVPGYVWMKFQAPEKLDKDFRLEMLDDAGYLSTEKLNAWMMSIVTRATNKFRNQDDELVFSLKMFGIKYQFEGTIRKAGPAVTLELTSDHFDIEIDIDLVPTFLFSGEEWPTGGYRANPVRFSKNEFFIVPKSPKDMDHAERYWRLSFQEQESELIWNKFMLKPTLKLLKMLRDTEEQDAIASYYIKTVFLWANEENDLGFWQDSMTNAFFKMLDKYIEYIESGNIPYFWNTGNNLLNLERDVVDNISNRLRNIRDDLRANYKTNPSVICKYLGANF